MVVRKVDQNDLIRIINKSPIPLVLLLCNQSSVCENSKIIIERLSKEFNGKIGFLYLDVNENPKIVRAFGIQSIPVYLFFDSGQLVNYAYNASYMTLKSICKQLATIIG